MWGCVIYYQKQNNQDHQDYLFLFILFKSVFPVFILGFLFLLHAQIVHS